MNPKVLIARLYCSADTDHPRFVAVPMDIETVTKLSRMERDRQLAGYASISTRFREAVYFSTLPKFPAEFQQELERVAADTDYCLMDIPFAWEEFQTFGHAVDAPEAVVNEKGFWFSARQYDEENKFPTIETQVIPYTVLLQIPSFDTMGYKIMEISYTDIMDQRLPDLVELFPQREQAGYMFITRLLLPGYLYPIAAEELTRLLLKRGIIAGPLHRNNDVNIEEMQFHEVPQWLRDAVQRNDLYPP